jgi:hypothetical protein
MPRSIRIDLTGAPIRRGSPGHDIRLLGAPSGAVQANFGGEYDQHFE